MWHPPRKSKDIIIKEKKEIKERKKFELSQEVIEVYKKEFEDKHIKGQKLDEILRDISLSQLSRFYSILEDRKFGKESKFIGDFLDKQIERAEVLGKDSDVGKAKRFFEYYRDNFLENEGSKISQEENEIYLGLLKSYFRYIIGQKRIEEAIKNDK